MQFKGYNLRFSNDLPLAKKSPKSSIFQTYCQTSFRPFFKLFAQPYSPYRQIKLKKVKLFLQVYKQIYQIGPFGESARVFRKTFKSDIYAIPRKHRRLDGRERTGKEILKNFI